MPTARRCPIAITLTCENAVAAAKAVVGPDPAVAYIEFAFGSWCPPGTFRALSLPNTGHVVFHRKGPAPGPARRRHGGRDREGHGDGADPAPIAVAVLTAFARCAAFVSRLRHSGQPGLPRVSQFARAIGDIA